MQEPIPVTIITQNFPAPLCPKAPVTERHPVSLGRDLFHLMQNLGCREVLQNATAILNAPFRAVIKATPTRWSAVLSCFTMHLHQEIDHTRLGSWAPPRHQVHNRTRLSHLTCTSTLGGQVMAAPYSPSPLTSAISSWRTGALFCLLP